MPVHDGHRERMKKRFLQHGLDNFDDHNVLELLLFYALPRQDTNELSHALLDTFGSIDRVFDASPEELMTVKGVGENAAVLLRLVPEAGKRYAVVHSRMESIITDADTAGRYLLPRFRHCQTEIVMLLCLDAKGQVLDCRQVGQGGINYANFSNREIIRIALLQNATSVILAHNHVAGIALPSVEDIHATKNLQQALRLVEVELVDHIIVGGDDFVSLADSGYLRLTGDFLQNSTAAPKKACK